nr:carbon storage regulator [Moritella viscosa]SHO03653.1 Global regulator protein [Moritella viscosa]
MSLVLSRRMAQAIIITTKSGEEIKLTIAGLQTNQVRLCFDADKSVSIDRAEIHFAKKLDREADLKHNK